MSAGIRDICIISTPEDLPKFKNLFQNGENFGINLEYIIQPKPEGIAQAFILAEHFIGQDDVTLILGDNLFDSNKLIESLSAGLNQDGAKIFVYPVSNPSDYGVLSRNSEGVPISIEEKPKYPKSNLAITGVYMFDSGVATYAKTITPSERGELEITSVISLYLKNGSLSLMDLGRGAAWLDTGTPNSLHDASTYVRVIEERTGKKLGCIEEVAYDNGWIDSEHLSNIASHFGNNSYGKYLRSLLR
jgi:glucose-1-phosphate thymidylyltransferase